MKRERMPAVGGLRETRGLEQEGGDAFRTSWVSARVCTGTIHVHQG